MGGNATEYYRDMSAPKVGSSPPLRRYVIPFRKLWSLHQVGHREVASDRCQFGSRAGCRGVFAKKFSAENSLPRFVTPRLFGLKILGGQLTEMCFRRSKSRKHWEDCRIGGEKGAKVCARCQKQRISREFPKPFC